MKLPVTSPLMLVLLLRGKDTSEGELTDRRIGLNMNYSIIFTEISLSPENSILLQIIRIIHMTIWIILESDRKGRAVCQIWLQGGIYNETPTDKRTRPDNSPSFKRRSEGSNKVP